MDPTKHRMGRIGLFPYTFYKGHWSTSCIALPLSVIGRSWFSNVLDNIVELDIHCGVYYCLLLMSPCLR